MTRYEDIINKIVTFRDERDWEQFHDCFYGRKTRKLMI